MPVARVMLVEDDPDIGLLISHTLRSAGYQVAWAWDGVQALQLAKQFPPALIVADFLFPAGGGAIFVQRARMSMRISSVPIVILSAVPKDLIAAAVDAGANAYYLPKPYANDELLGLLAGMLSGTANPAYLLHDDAAAASAPRPARGCVLVIDGNGEERALIRSALEKKGFRVAEAGGGAEAMNALGLDGGRVSPEAARPSLIILDAQIDFGAGHLVNARLARETSTHSVPVVVITGGEETRAAFSGATNVAAYLDKPLDPQLLLRHAEELVPIRG